MKQGNEILKKLADRYRLDALMIVNDVAGKKYALDRRSELVAMLNAGNLARVSLLLDREMADAAIIESHLADGGNNE